MNSRRSRLRLVALTGAIVCSASVATAQVLVWRRAIEGVGTVTGVAPGPADGGYATGTTVAGEPLLVHLDAAGNEIWRRTVHVSLAGMAGASDGVVVVGTAAGTAFPGDTDVWVRKYTVAGDIAWERQFTSANLDAGHDIAVGPGDEVYVVGFFDGLPPTGTGSDVLLRKYDRDGNELWTVHLDRPATASAAPAVTVADDGTVFVAGADLLFAFGPAGETLWSRDATALIDVAAGGAGISAADSLFLHRYDAAGTELWSTRPFTELRAVAADNAARTFAAGNTLTFMCPPFPFQVSINLICSIGFVGRLAQFDPAGVMRWTATESGTLTAVAAGDGFLFVGGRGGFPAGGFVSKYVANFVRGEMDVLPGSVDDVLKASRRGVVPVAILTSDVFDATTIRPDTACFGGLQPSACGEAHGRSHIEDVDGDGDLDVVLHFEMAASGLQPGDTLACVTAKTTDASIFADCDTISVTR